MYHLSPCIVALPNKRVQSDAAAAAWYRGENWLYNALRIEADFGTIAAQLTRQATPQATGEPAQPTGQDTAEPAGNPAPAQDTAEPAGGPAQPEGPSANE